MKRARVAVAFSGGRDSTALLHVTRRVATALGVEVVALHVHHGLHADADAWLQHCERLCKRWKVAFAATRLDGVPAAGDSIEAWARAARYGALAQMARAQGASLVLLAQHRRDQAETFLLQALRGAGMAGLASMPVQAERDGLVWVRPWLAQPRETIEAHVRRHRLRYVDDGSNDDARHARNRLRRDVWPALCAAFPNAEAVLADAATRAGRASVLLDAVAEQDLGSTADDALDIARWCALEPLRRDNALRRWLQRQGLAHAALIERLMRELPTAQAARWPTQGGRELRLYRGRLSAAFAEAPSAASHADALLHIERAGDYALPEWGGHLSVKRTRRGGVGDSALGTLRVVARHGGERFQLAPRATPRSLKKQFQALGIAAWQRDGPLLYSGERLLYVPGLGIDARCRAADGEPQYALQWIADTRR